MRKDLLGLSEGDFNTLSRLWRTEDEVDIIRFLRNCKVKDPRKLLDEFKRSKGVATASDVLEVITEHRQIPYQVCPHCNTEIYEKHTYLDDEGIDVHKDCGNKIYFPVDPEQQRQLEEFYKSWKPEGDDMLQVTLIEESADNTDNKFPEIAKEMRAMPSVKSKDAKISLRKKCIGLQYSGNQYYLVRDISEARKEATASADSEIEELIRDFKRDDRQYKIKARRKGEDGITMKTLMGDTVSVESSYETGTDKSHDARFGEQVSLISQKPSVELVINGKTISLTWGEAAELAQGILQNVSVGYYG